MLRDVLFLVALVRIVAAAGPGNKNAGKQPHILFIVADDLGWNDVPWHNNEIIAPNLKQLAEQGVILEQAYVSPICTPSRTSFMTGYYPYHVGSQHSVFMSERPQGVPTGFTFLPQKLKDLGYATRMVGKWHLGFCNWHYTPTYRGFDSFYGYYNAAGDHYLHTIAENPAEEAYLDLRDNEDVVRTETGNYSTFLFTDRAVDIIKEHSPETHLFLYLPFSNVHAPLQVPDRFEQLYPNVREGPRKTLLGMVSAVDEAIGNVTTAMKDAGLWDNTLLIFTTDNGGWINRMGNNYPFRGGKFTLWEGGTKGAAFVHGPNMLQTEPYINKEMIHAVDWFPTILEAAGGNADGSIDGMSQLDTILKGKPSPRTEFVYNIDDIDPGQAAIRVGDYKLIEGKPGVPSGWIYPGDQAGSELGKEPLTGTWLYNLKDDPTERINLADAKPEKLQEMRERLEEYRATIVPAIWPDECDDEADPANYWDEVWSPGWCNTLRTADYDQASLCVSPEDSQAFSQQKIEL